MNTVGFVSFLLEKCQKYVEGGIFFFYTCIIELKIKKCPVPAHDVDNKASEYKTQ